MKRLITTIVLTAALCAITVAPVGCTTITSEQQQDSAASLANLAAYTGTALHLEDNETDAPFFAAAVAALDRIADDGTYTPAALAAALEDLPVDVLQDKGKASIIIMGTVMLYDEIGRQILDPMTPEAVKKIAGGIRNGIHTALVRFDSQQSKPQKPTL